MSPTGAPTDAPMSSMAQQGEYLTTAHGTRLGNSDQSLKAGPRGPVLLQDHHFREKISHFDHERIPERVVHARGYGAHGVFECHESLADITRASIFASAVSYTHLTLPTTCTRCRSRWSPYH